MNIIINYEVGKVMVAVEDDGRGFAKSFSLKYPLRAELDKGFGLFRVKERNESIGGSVRIISESGVGATVAISCPLRLKADVKN